MQPVVYRVCIYWDYACAHFSCCRLTHSGTTAVNLWLSLSCILCLFIIFFLCILCVVVEMFEAARKGVTPGQRLIDTHPSSTIHYTKGYGEDGLGGDEPSRRRHVGVA
ncbi:hypothetical protein Hdeb2414_s0027g00693141 [Helianthus debilis subsp. tardiflorus]